MLKQHQKNGKSQKRQLHQTNKKNHKKQKTAKPSKNFFKIFPEGVFFDMQSKAQRQALEKKASFKYLLAPREKRGTTPKIMVGPVAKLGEGYGAFAGEDIKKGKIIGEYWGVKKRTEDASEAYAFELDSHRVVDPSQRGNCCRFINENVSCPNAAIVKEKGKLLVVALRDIKMGEQITFNYSETYEIFYKKNGIERLPIHTWDNHQSWIEKIEERSFFIFFLTDKLLQNLGLQTLFAYVTPIAHAVIQRDPEALKEALKKYPDYVNWPVVEAYGEELFVPEHMQRELSPLMLACYFGDLELISILLEFGAEVNQLCFTFQTPLFFAINSPFISSAEKSAIIRLFLAKEVDFFIQDKKNMSILHYLVDVEESYRIDLPSEIFYSKKVRNKPSCVFDLLNNDNLCPIKYAFAKNNLQLANVFIEKFIEVKSSLDEIENKAQLLFEYLILDTFQNDEESEEKDKFQFFSAIPTKHLKEFVVFILDIFKKYNNNSEFEPIKIELSNYYRFCIENNQMDRAALLLLVNKSYIFISSEKLNASKGKQLNKKELEYPSEIFKKSMDKPSENGQREKETAYLSNAILDSSDQKKLNRPINIHSKRKFSAESKQEDKSKKRKIIIDLTENDDWVGKENDRGKRKEKHQKPLNEKKLNVKRNCVGANSKTAISDEHDFRRRSKESVEAKTKEQLTQKTSILYSRGQFFFKTNDEEMVVNVTPSRNSGRSLGMKGENS